MTTYRNELLAALLAMQVADKRAGYNRRCHLNLDANGQPAVEPRSRGARRSPGRASAGRRRGR